MRALGTRATNSSDRGGLLRQRIPFRQQVFEIDSCAIQKRGVVQGRSEESLAEILAVIIISSRDDNGQQNSPPHPCPLVTLREDTHGSPER